MLVNTCYEVRVLYTKKHKVFNCGFHFSIPLFRILVFISMPLSTDKNHIITYVIQASVLNYEKFCICISIRIF